MTKERINEYTLRISQANRSQIIVILYEMAIDYIDAGIEAIHEKNHDELRLQCGHATKVISDLIGSLDYSYELAFSLRNVYIFIQTEISRAVIINGEKELVKSKEMLLKLKESFDKVALEDKSGKVMKNTESVYAGLTYGKKAIYDSLTTEVSRGFKV